MRWNGVFILGLGLIATSFAGIGWTHAAPVSADAAPRVMGLLISVLAAGALTACLGTLIGRQKTVRGRRSRRTRFTGRASGNGTRTRNFGQRAEYSALGKQPAAPRPIAAGPVALLPGRTPQ